MRKSGILIVTGLFAAAAIACADAAEDRPPEPGADLEQALSRGEAGVADTLRAGVDAAAGVADPDADGGSGTASGSAPDAASGSANGGGVDGQPGATSPAGASPSSARDGSTRPGGDDLGRRRDVGAPPAVQGILERAASAYAAVRTLRADFQQTSYNPVLRRTTTSRGTIFQARPDRFLMRFSEPAGDRIVSDGTHIWVYYPSVDEGQVIRMTAGAGGAGAVDLQAQFLGDPTTRFDATLHGSEDVGGRAAHVVTLVPRRQEAFRSLKVWIDQRDHLVRRFEITEHNGVVRTFVLSDLTPGAQIDDGLFRFTPPAGAHVVARD